MQEIPLVSIIITTHNRGDILKRAINSAINQSYKNIEIIIVDDGSTDNTEFVVQEYIASHPNIYYIKHDIPKGANAARNMGIRSAKGIYVAGLDDDDEFMPQRIELLINAYSDKYSLIAANDILIINNNKEKITNKPSIITLALMRKENVINNQILVKKDRILEIGGFDENLAASQDYDMWIRIIKKYGDAFVVKTPLQKIYISDSVKRISTGSKKFTGYFNFYKKHKKLFTNDDKKYQLAKLYRIRNKKISFSTLLTLLNFYTFKQYIRQFVLKG